MNAIESFWGMVSPGAYVRDASPDAVTWRVDRLDDTRAMLFNPQRGSVIVPRPPADKPVTVLEPTMDEAVATVEAELGGRVVAEQATPGGVYRCDPFVISPRGRTHVEQRDHLTIMHSMYIDDVKTGAGLLEAHDSSHADNDPRYIRPHVHREK